MPRTKPLALHRRHGTLRKRHAHAVDAPTSRPTCPDHLDATAREEWGRLLDEMGAVGTLARVDRATLAAHCVTYSRWIQAEQQIAATGTVIRTQAGEARVSPWVKVAQDCLAVLRQFAIELGLSPASRTRIKAMPSEATVPEVMKRERDRGNNDAKQ